MKDVRTIISENLTELRKEKKLTQLELAEKFNYSDKAVSKWENGDTLPDIEVLQQLCEYYGVTLDYLTHEGNRKEKAQYVTDKTEKQNHIAISALIGTGVWILATVIFVYYWISAKQIYWPVFVYAAPVSCVFFLICNRIYFKSRTINFIAWSCFVWGSIASFYIGASFANVENYADLWPLFLVGIPLEGALVIWYLMKKKKK